MSTGRYVGHLATDDPFYGYLQSLVPQQGAYADNARYRVFRFSDSRDVYLYQEKHTGLRWIGKFFKSDRPGEAKRRGETEFNNLDYLRNIGFSSAPHYVVRPFGFNPFIDNVLVVEFIPEQSLSSIIDNAIHGGNRGRLFRKLSALAHFLAELHNRTAGEYTVDFDDPYHYTASLVQSLIANNGIDRGLLEGFQPLREAWRQRGYMWEDRRVIVHGDTTPANFLFGRANYVIAIDLERMHWADRVFDLGRLCGELKHFFLRATEDPQAAEPFIGHFLWEYARYFPDRESAFYSITRRIPFYMGITLLRIARNTWIDTPYRFRLIREAKQILAGGLQ